MNPRPALTYLVLFGAGAGGVVCGFLAAIAFALGPVAGTSALGWLAWSVASLAVLGAWMLLAIFFEVDK